MSEQTTQTQEQIDAAAKAKAEKEAAAAKAKAEKEAAAAKAKEEKAAAKAAAEEARAKAKAEKDAATAKAKEEKAEAARLKAEAKAKAAAEKAAAAPAKVAMPSQNGVTRPKPDSQCGKIWGMADALSAKLRQPVTIAILIKETAAAGINDATTRTQYARWKQFNGVFGRVEAPAANSETAAAAA